VSRSQKPEARSQNVCRLTTTCKQLFPSPLVCALVCGTSTAALAAR
jgi:hypothetical protein